MTKDTKEPALECEEWFYLSLSEVSTSFGVSKDLVLEIIDEGIVSVQRDEKDRWRFDTQSLRQIRTILRLNHDLGVNVAGAGLALQLLEEIDKLRSLLHEKR